MKDKILKALPDFIDKETGYLHTNKRVVVGSLGNILEYTGQLLMSLDDKALIFELLKGLRGNEVIDGLVPRTKDFICPRDKDLSRWETFNCTWWRTDVSHSQFTYLAMGLDSVTHNSLAKNMLKRMLQRLRKNKFKIKNVAGKTTPDGDFWFWGNQGLRKLYLLKLSKKYSVNLKISLLEYFLLLLNLKIMKKGLFKNKESDSYNTWILMKVLKEDYDKYTLKMPSEFDLTYDIKSAIKYLLLGGK